MKEDLEYIYEFVNDKIKIERREKDYNLLKAESDVFDRKTMLTLYDLLSHGYFDIIEFPIKIGKEANIFRAKKGRKYYVVKIYRTSTKNFNSIIKYIEGDYRFEHFKRSTLGIIYLWAQKEFRNLTDCYNASVLVPKPVVFRNNIVVMEYLGNSRYPAPLLKDYPQDLQKFYGMVRDNVLRMVNDALLVHGDLSEYNIVIHKDKPYIIDVSQAMPVKHPNARTLLERDVRNIVRFFSKKGVDANEKDFYDSINWGVFV
ncbi:MAG: serine protein kinase RIO [Euryarchaeota archaeon]|nr:serine protein kinase RIO [Euryarchaeota archaeon]